MVSENPTYTSGMAVGQGASRFVVREEEERLLAERHMGGGRSYVAWSAVIAGALSAMAILVVFAAFAYAVDIPAYRGGEFGWGAGIWCLVSASVAFLFGGFIVSYLTPRFEMSLGLMHGILAWVLATILTMALSAGAAGMFRGLMVANAFWLGVLPLNGTATPDQILGAGWAAFLALICGLVAAAIGGIAGYYANLRTIRKAA